MVKISPTRRVKFPDKFSKKLLGKFARELYALYKADIYHIPGRGGV
jgi:hypothetical protein